MPILHRLDCVGVDNPDVNRFKIYTSTEYVVWLLIPVISALGYSVRWDKLKQFNGDDNDKPNPKEKDSKPKGIFDI